MEKERRSGQPYHIRPLESLSGSRPEKTVTEASDGDLQGQHQQRRDGRGVAAEQKGHKEQVTGLGENTQAKQE